jgi:SAM-dependent methyltransferase
VTGAETGQVSKSAAEVYDEFFVPALFEQWGAPVCDEARIGSGMTVVDIACGTGALTLEAKRRAGSTGRVIGLDCNGEMLAAAHRKARDIEWVNGRAEDLPFGDSTFDAVVSQFGLMFFEDRTKALAEMWRVLRPGGRLVVAVWAGLERSPGYSELVGLLDRLFGPEAANALRAPFSLGENDLLSGTLKSAGIDDAVISLHEGSAVFPSMREWMHTEIRGWTLADMIDDDQFAALVHAAEIDLARFVRSDDAVEFECPALFATAVKRELE